jgi:hypothetical protein
VSFIEIFGALLLVAGSILVVGILWLFDTVTVAAASGPRLKEVDEIPAERDLDRAA